MLHNGLGEHRKVELVSDLVDVLHRAVFKQNVNGWFLGVVGMVRGNAL